LATFHGFRLALADYMPWERALSVNLVAMATAITTPWLASAALAIAGISTLALLASLPRKPKDNPALVTIGTNIETGHSVSLNRSILLRRTLFISIDDTRRRNALQRMAIEGIETGSGAAIFLERDDNDGLNRILAAARKQGMEDDVLIIDTTPGHASERIKLFPESEGNHVLSNTLAPIYDGKLSPVVQDLLYAATRIAIQKCGIDAAHADIGATRNAAALESILDTAHDDTLPERIRMSAQTYLGKLPGYDPDVSWRQSDTIIQAHSQYELELNEILTALEEAPCFSNTDCTIDLKDVVFNDRILIIRSSATRRDAIVKRFILREIVQAAAKQVVLIQNEKRPRQLPHPSPFLLVFDHLDECMRKDSLLIPMAFFYDAGVAIATAAREVYSEIGYFHHHSFGNIVFLDAGELPSTLVEHRGARSLDELVLLMQSKAPAPHSRIGYASISETPYRIEVHDPPPYPVSPAFPTQRN